MSDLAMVAFAVLLLGNGALCFVAAWINRSTLRELIRREELLRVENRKAGSRVGEGPVVYGREAYQLRPEVDVPRPKIQMIRNGGEVVDE